MSKLYEATKTENGIKIYLNGNENSFNPFKEKVNGIQIKGEKINRYPDDNYRDLKTAYAKYINLKASNLIVGNGSDEVINLVISYFINKGEKLITLEPDFSMYDFYTTLNEGEIKKFKLVGSKGINIEEFITFINKENPKIIIFSNPNNPTGVVLKREDIIKILEETKNIVIIDEAYYEFYGDTVVELVENYENLLVTRTLSKAWGMASLRVGFLVSNEKLIKTLENHKVPYNVNRISEEIAIKMLEDVEAMKNSVKEIIKEREFLYKELDKLKTEDFIPLESKGNYICIKTKKNDFIYEKLKEKGILIRNFKNNSLRITIGKRVENLEVIKILKEVLS
ncbi:MAG: histidinol-phosphate transaminase [Sarcina sp.]